MFVSMSVSVSVSLSMFMSVFMSAFASTDVSVSASMSLCLFLRLCMYVCVCVSVPPHTHTRVHIMYIHNLDRMLLHVHICTGWRRLIRCLKSQVRFRKRATNYRALCRKLAYKDKASYDYTPQCRVILYGKEIGCAHVQGIMLSTCIRACIMLGSHLRRLSMHR